MGRCLKDGDTGWEVVWCKVLPCLPDDPTTCDTDNAIYGMRTFRDMDEAYAFAKKVYPKSQTGAVEITPFVLERLCDDPWHPDFNSCRTYTADPDYYEGDT